MKPSIPHFFLGIFLLFCVFNKLSAESFPSSDMPQGAIPPEDAERIELQCIKYYWAGWMTMKKYKFESIQGAVKEDSVYFKCSNFKDDDKSYIDDDDRAGWIKGIVEGDNLRIRNGELLFPSIKYAGFSSETGGNDTVNVFAYGANFGEDDYREEYNSKGTLKYFEFNMPVSCTKKDIITELNPETLLIHNPQSGILVAPEPLSKISYAMYTYDHFHIEAIESLLIGQFAPEEPERLPQPTLSIVKRTSSDNQTYYDPAVYLNLVTEDGWLLDFNKLYISVYQGDTYIMTSSFTSSGNPFINGHTRRLGYSVQDESEVEDIRIFCYYLREDGTRLLSEWVDKNGVVGIPPLTDEELEFDIINGSSNAVYDLSGRRMKDVENLSPGIYIRAGKKFVVR